MRISKKSILCVSVFLASNSSFAGILQKTCFYRKQTSLFSGAFIGSKLQQSSHPISGLSAHCTSDSLFNKRSLDKGFPESVLAHPPKTHAMNPREIEKIHSTLLKTNKMLLERLTALRSSLSDDLPEHKAQRKDAERKKEVLANPAMIQKPLSSALAASEDNGFSNAGLRGLYVNRVFNTEGIAHQIQRDQLIELLDLYLALPHRSMEGISRVLTGEVDTGKSLIYGDVCKYIASKNEDLTKYRTIYADLCSAANQPAHIFLSEIAQVMMDERISQRSSLRDDFRTTEDFMEHILSAVNPIYPVTREQVLVLRDVYVGMSHRPRNGITRVLAAEVATGKSTIYSEIVQYLSGQNRSLKECCDIYGRLIHSRNKHIMNVFFQMVDQTPNLDGMPHKEEIKQINTLNDINIQKAQKESEYYLDQPPKQKVTNRDSETTESEENDLDKSVKRISRIYGLLPEYHGKSITGVLSGATTNKSLPIWGDLEWAISKIQQEIFAEGGSTQVDLKYFQDQYSKLQQSDPNILLDVAAHAYKITAQQSAQLARLYTLLSQYHGKSITGALTGATTNERLPIWDDLDKAIKIIQQEIAVEGDPVQVNLKYFQRLYWSSMRCYGTVSK